MNSAKPKAPSIFGGIMLVIGNIIGAGILALPIATSQLGMFYAALTLCFFWLLMMLGAYYFLEANLTLPANANLISMSRRHLGYWGVCVAWGCNLIVMYSLIAAYISGGSDLIQVNAQQFGLLIPTWISALLFLLIFGYIVSLGIAITDYTNRCLMTLKSGLFFAFLVSLASKFNVHALSLNIPSNQFSGSLLIVALTSYGFAVLVPSLRSYYQSDVLKLRKIIFWGTGIPFLCYIIWVTLVLALIPYTGTYGLKSIADSAHPLSDLQSALSDVFHMQWLVQIMNIFSAICILTSFLANSISFTDFIADGYGLYHNGKKKVSVYLIAYAPALATVLFFPRAFLLGLSIAGWMAIIQLLLLPGLILWYARYITKNSISPYQVIGGKPLLVGFIIISILLLFFVWL